ncbi:MAG: PAS domain S-box protein [Desulfosporosinus sp.]|nr:PAS domain S-box protein [Desulfosporosinus sp.]
MRINKKSPLSSFTVLEKKRMLVLLLLMLGLWSLFYIRYSWIAANQAASDVALIIARTAEASFPKNAISLLENPSPQDVETLQYKQIKNSLQNLASINQTIRYAYLYVQKDGKLYFMADSEPVNSKNYSPPGQEFTGAAKVYGKPFEQGGSIITPPVTDPRGTWVSVLVPIKDIETGKVRAVFAMDYPAEIWNKAVLCPTAQASAIVLTFFLLSLALFMILIKNEAIKEEGRKLVLANEEIVKAKTTYQDMFEKSQAMMMLIEAESGKIINANMVACEFYGYTLEQLKTMHITEINSMVQPELLQKMSSAQTQECAYFELEHRLASGEYRAVEVFSSPIRINDHMYLHSIINDVTHRKTLEKTLEQAHENFKNFFNSIDDLLYVVDKQGIIIHVNSAVYKKLCYCEGELIGKSVLLVHPENKRDEVETIVMELLSGNVNYYSTSAITKYGQEIPVELCITAGEWNGEAVTFGVMKDISAITRSEQKYKLLFTAMNDAFSHQSILCDERGKPIDFRFITANPSFEAMTGLKSEAIIGKTATEVMPDVDQAEIELYGRVALTGESVHFNTFSRSSNKYFEVKAYSPSANEFATIFTDITERVECEKDIHYLNYHDALTGLYNRRFYEEEIKRLDIERNLPIVLIYGDVNGLKLINDVFGHLKGDELLQKAASAMRSACRADDIIARWGGDEFVVLLPRTNSEEAEVIVKRIKEAYAKESVNSISGSISFGWDTKCSIDEDILKTLKNAEDLMYKNKTLETEKIRLDTIKTLVVTLEKNYPGTEDNSKRVSELCQAIARTIGLAEWEVCKVRSAGFFRDIGNISIEKGLLNKPRKLREQEWDEVKRHPEIGFRILCSSHEMSELADYVLAHHERWDGTGYPKGLQGINIPIEARIIAIACSYVAMTSERPYRSAFTEEVARQEILKNAGTQFDPEIAKVFVEKILDKPWDWPANLGNLALTAPLPK